MSDQVGNPEDLFSHNEAQIMFQLLAKLLKSKNPDDLQAANRLIKNMVKQVIIIVHQVPTCFCNGQWFSDVQVMANSAVPVNELSTYVSHRLVIIVHSFQTDWFGKQSSSISDCSWGEQSDQGLHCLLFHLHFMEPVIHLVFDCSGPICSKLTTSLVNVLLKF